MVKKKTRKVFFNELDITAITLDASEKGGWADVVLHLPTGEVIPDLRNALQPQDYTVRIAGHVRIDA